MKKYLRHYTLKIWKQFIDGVYSTLKCIHLENLFHYIDNLPSNINFNMGGKSNGKLEFLETLLELNNGKISVLVYTKPAYTDQYLQYNSHHQTSCKKNFDASLFNRAYSIITSKDDLNKEDTRIKHVLKENGYQEGIISKIFKGITNNHSLPQSQQQTLARDIQREEVRMSIIFSYVKGTS